MSLSKPVKTEQWAMDDFQLKYTKGRIQKPRMQRKIRWSINMIASYIKFIIVHQNTCLPLFVNEMPRDDGGYVYMLFDGNNRVNAILMLLNTPLIVLPELIPSELEELRPTLNEIPLGELLQRDLGTITKFCSKFKIPHDKFPAETYESIYEKMIERLDTLHFSKVKIQVNIHDGLSADEMGDIFTSINKNSTKMTTQELYACSLSTWCYSEVIHHKELYPLIEGYYDDTNERIKMTESFTNLNLFEILIALHMFLHEKYEGFVPPLKTDTDELCLTFHLAQVGLNIPKTRPSQEEVNSFIRDILIACGHAQSIFEKIVDPITKFDFKKSKKKHISLMMILYLMKNKSELNIKKENIHKSIIYTTALTDVYGADKIPTAENEKDMFSTVNGSSKKNGVYSSIGKGEFRFAPITEEDLCYLLKKISEKNTTPIQSRKKTTWFEAVALSAFYNQQVPAITKEMDHQIDHIVPFSLRKQSDIDICRPGNKQIIPTKINASRKTKPITDKWITDNKLMYQNYPTELEYAMIFRDDGTIDEARFNEMCERRENQYIEHIISACSY